MNAQIVDKISKLSSSVRRSHYDANYGNFQSPLYEDVRRDAFGEDIGQNSWLTASEQDRFLSLLLLSSGKKLLDVGCGAGGPSLRLAELTGTSVLGIDVHEQAIATATTLAAQRGLTPLVEFRVMDAAQRLPFSDGSFDAITCIDSINHFPDRRRVVTEWRRLLRPEGRLLFTDPIVVTGPLTDAEIAIRSSAGFYWFVPRGYNEHLLLQCGMRVIASEDVTQNMADGAGRRRAARQARRLALLEIEGDTAYDAQQEFLRVANLVAAEGRLSRFMFLVERLS